MKFASNGMAKVQGNFIYRFFWCAGLTSCVLIEFVNGTDEPDLGKDSSRRLFWERVDCGK